LKRVTRTFGALALILGFTATGYTMAAAAADASDAAPPAEGNPAHGRALSYTCLGCHGIANYENAYPMYRVPKLAGQRAEYIVAALQGYRDGDRGHATMHAQASSMSDADMRDIAAYLSSALPAAAGREGGEPRGTAPAAGQVCTACHGANGVSIAGQFPSLAGQYEDYLRRALTEYRQGGRKNAVMANFAGQLQEADIALLAAYYSQQPSVLGTVPKRWSVAER
jgi:cytochrome c553